MCKCAKACKTWLTLNLKKKVLNSDFVNKYNNLEIRVYLNGNNNKAKVKSSFLKKKKNIQWRH